MKVNQRTATCNTLLAVLENGGVNYELNGPKTIASVLTDKMRAETREALFVMFRSGEVSYSSDFQSKVDDDVELKKYISGLVNNWIRKAPEFNSDTKYQAKNPGSRAGSGDGQIREMKKLLTLITDADQKKVIQAEIESRQAEIKVKTVEVDYSKIPAHLREALGI